MHALICISIDNELCENVWRQLSLCFIAYSLAVRIFYFQEDITMKQKKRRECRPRHSVKKALSIFLSLFVMITSVLASFTIVEAAESWLWPVPSSKTINANYGDYVYGQFHYGLDIGGAYGCSVVASKSGTVVYSRYGDVSGVYYGGGNFVVIKHDDGKFSHYAHLSSRSVSEGQRVSRGQEIGKMGSSGNSSGTHLHFAIANNSTGEGGRINNNTSVIGYSYDFHNHNYVYSYDQSAHPHYAVNKCTSCGQTTVTSKTNTSVACDICHAASEGGYYVKNFSFPKVIKKGDDINVTGTLYASKKIRWVVGNIIDENRNILQKNSEKWPYTLEYDLVNINDQLDFSKLEVGEYFFMLQSNATDMSDMDALWRPFKVTESGFDKVDIVSPDGYLVYGDDFDISGIINSCYSINWCHALIQDSNGTELYKSVGKPTSNTFDISTLNDGLDFSLLEPGDYKYYVKAGTYLKGDMPNIVTTFTVVCDHKYGTWETDIIKQPTCAEDGLKTVTCSKCNESHDELIPATNEHIYKAVEDNNGYIRYTCTECGNTFIEISTHFYTLVSSEEPTCTEEGLEVYFCECGRVVNQSIDALGHNYQFKGYEDGVFSYQCSDCEKTNEKIIASLPKVEEEFAEKVIRGKNNMYIDFNNDGYVNAKDYVILHDLIG